MPIASTSSSVAALSKPAVTTSSSTARVSTTRCGGSRSASGGLAPRRPQDPPPHRPPPRHQPHWRRPTDPRLPVENLHMNTLRPALLLVLVSCLASAAAAQGVQTGVLRGIVVDGQELPVPGVAVTIASPAMQGPRTATSGPDGGFVFRPLPAGDYEVQLDIQGFTPERRTATVPLGQAAELHVTLRPGAVTERVIVEA